MFKDTRAAFSLRPLPLRCPAAAGCLLTWAAGATSVPQRREHAVCRHIGSSPHSFELCARASHAAAAVCRVVACVRGARSHVPAASPRVKSPSRHTSLVSRVSHTVPPPCRHLLASCIVCRALCQASTMHACIQTLDSRLGSGRSRGLGRGGRGRGLGGGGISGGGCGLVGGGRRRLLGLGRLRNHPGVVVQVVQGGACRPCLSTFSPLFPGALAAHSRHTTH